MPEGDLVMAQQLRRQVTLARTQTLTLFLTLALALALTLTPKHGRRRGEPWRRRRCCRRMRRE